jgi:hypothetical protein
VPGRSLSLDELTSLLERCSSAHAGRQGAVAAGQPHVELLVARVAALTEALRDADSNDTTRLAERILVADLTLLATQFRTGAHAIGTSLVRAQDTLGDALERAGRAAGSAPR